MSQTFETAGDIHLTLTEQIVRLQALLEASRAVHSTINLTDVLQQSANIVVRELEMEGATFTSPYVLCGKAAGWSCRDAQRRLSAVQPPRTRWAIALGVSSCPHREGGLSACTSATFWRVWPCRPHLQSRMRSTTSATWSMPALRRIWRLHALSSRVSCRRRCPPFPATLWPPAPGPATRLGGDYLDMITEPDGSYLMVVADVAGKGLASALVCTTFRSAFRALARQSLTLDELASRLSQQHWDEGIEARNRYVTAIFLRLDPESGELEMVNAGHNPAFLLSANDGTCRMIRASGTPLGMLPRASYKIEHAHFEPDSRLLLYTDGLTEIFSGG